MHDPTIAGAGPWRVLLLDLDLADPKFILATVTDPDDVLPVPDDPGELSPGTAAGWVAERTGQLVTLVPMAGTQAWRVDGGEPR